MLGLVSDDGVRYRLVRTGLDGSRRTYSLPPSPPISEEIGPAPRTMGPDLDVAGDLVAFGWRREDGYAGAAAATADLSEIVVEFDDDKYCCHPVGSDDGRRFAFALGDRVEVVDVQGNAVAGPFSVGRADGQAGVGTWAPDGRRLIVSGSGRTMVLDTRTGALQRIDFAVHGAVSWMGHGRDLLMEVHGDGPTPQSLYVRAPGGSPRLLTADGSYGESSPDGSRVVFGRSPYEDGRAGRASVHMISADGTGERLLFATRNAIAYPIGWSPDGAWIAVHLGGPG
jgi:hypothetical protein